MICFLLNGAVAMALRMLLAILFRHVGSGIGIPAERDIVPVAHVDARRTRR